MNATRQKSTQARRRGSTSNEARPFAYRNRSLTCDGFSLTELAETYGTPLYVYSAGHIADRYAMYTSAFSNTAHTVCYSVKANSSLAILRLLGDRGAGFDIVSGGELERVRRACPTAAKRIVFSGVGKQAWEIDAALKAKIMIFNVESEAELELLAARAAALKIKARFALRVNPDVFAETHPYISTGLSEHKFGIAIGLARAIYGRARKYQWLDAAGVSVHIGSQIRSVEPFAAALERVLSLIAELKADGHPIRFVDIGGGLGIEYGADDFDPRAEVQRYAASISSLKLGGLHLLLEPGRFLVAQAGGLLARVLYVKPNGTKTFVVTDAGMNDLIRPALYQAHHEILPVRQRLLAKSVNQAAAAAGKVDVVGPVCESGDFFARDRFMPHVKPGELLLILDAGAYGMSLASNYNTRARAAEVLVEQGSARLIRRRESLRAMLAAEVLP